MDQTRLGRDAGPTFERFTDRARSVLVYAQDEARRRSDTFIGTKHLLLGLIREGRGVVATAIESFGISIDAARAKVDEMVGRAPSASRGAVPFTPRTKKVLEMSVGEALKLGHAWVDTEHLLLGLVRDGQGGGAQALVGLGAALDEVRQHVVGLMSGHGPAGGETGAETPVGRPTEARLATVGVCSFCGRQPPESGRLVAGAHALICEHCIRAGGPRIDPAGAG